MRTQGVALHKTTTALVAAALDVRRRRRRFIAARARRLLIHAHLVVVVVFLRVVFLRGVVRGVRSNAPSAMRWRRLARARRAPHASPGAPMVVVGVLAREPW